MRVVKGHWQLMLIVIVVFALWQTPLTTPLKILVVFMHEVSHGLAAVFTGGSIESISVSLNQGGLTTTYGGSAFAIASAGYVGSLIIGVILFLVALRSNFDRAFMVVLGIAVLLIAAFYIRETFALAFALVIGVMMLASARYLSVALNDIAIRVIGLTSMIYVPYDIFDDTIARSDLPSDAYMMAEMFGGPTVFWGGMWLVISLAVIGACFRYGLNGGSNIRFGSS